MDVFCDDSGGRDADEPASAPEDTVAANKRAGDGALAFKPDHPAPLTRGLPSGKLKP